MAIILDLDNTICNDEWRIPKIRWESKDPMIRYHDYHCLSSFDEPGNCDLFVGTPLEIFILTARPSIYRAQTIEWLRRNGIDQAVVLMRNVDDHRPSVELKKSQVKALQNIFGCDLTGEIECCYDDREDVVQMYRSLGFKAERRAIHNTCAYTGAKAGAIH